MIDMKEMAKQLRLPEGENSKIVTEFMSKGNRTLYDFTLDQFTFFSSAEVLEIGPANGFFVQKLFERNNSLSYTGLDLSHDMITEANELNSALVTNGNARFVYGDVVSLPFRDESFDIIFTVNTLYFWSDPKVGMAELKRVLRPNGKLVIAIRSKETMVNMPFTEYGFQLYSKVDLQNLFSENGFNDATISSKMEDITLPSGVSVNIESFCALGEKR
ncbi:MAG: class I SAM-dependent methyltransferase [Bacteroidia bacterium]|nr:class I SAM-dependent methyltransferase [Bacteroidia bacterium]MBP9922433.1 class I SAM-dependent methyltransferase [Bacteroidia bacterium]